MNIYVGYDSRESSAYDVCKFSLEQNTTHDIKITPLMLQQLRRAGTYTRPHDIKSSTEFTFSRFLVPYLQQHTGWAMFCDCDFVWLDDVSKLFECCDDKYAVMVVKHDYTPKETVKMDGAAQEQYPRKNWSSMVLWNCDHQANQCVTPDLVNSQTGMFLHRFMWLDDHQIGEISHEWNWLTDWYDESTDGTPRALHFTQGGPWFEQYKHTKYAEVWNEYHHRYTQENNG